MRLAWDAQRAFLQPFDKRTTTIAAEAREVRCGRQGLEGATYSDHGYVIIGVYFAPGRQAQDGSSFDGMCDDRARQSYNSGMGEIFRQVAAISPVEIGGALVAPTALPPRQLVSLARREGLATRGRERNEILAALHEHTPARLRKLRSGVLRAAATHLGLGAPPVKTKADKEALIGRLADALSYRAGRGHAPPRPLPAATAAELQKLTARELQREVDRRGLDRRHCFERADLLKLLSENGAVTTADASAGRADEIDDASEPRTRVEHNSSDIPEPVCSYIIIRWE